MICWLTMLICSSLWNNVVLMHYPWPSRHVPQGLHEENSCIPLRRVTPGLVSRLQSHYARQPPQMQHTNVVPVQYVLNTLWDMEHCDDQKTFWQRTMEKRVWHRANLPSRTENKLKPDAAAFLPSLLHLPACKNHPEEITALMDCVIFQTTLSANSQYVGLRVEITAQKLPKYFPH